MQCTGRRRLDGPRPIDLHRDIRAVTDLIVLSFGDRLDAGGQMALEQMRRRARRRVWTQWFIWPDHERPGAVRSGYVWEECGRVVGNVSLRPALERGGFVIGNVCVHPDWRRRGIARALMETALHEIGRHGGRWVGLEVRADNIEARGLYESIGFREVGRTLRLVRPHGLPLHLPEVRARGFVWRRGVHRDSQALFRLAQVSIPLPLHPLLEVRRADYEAGWERTISSWLSGKPESWWIAETGDGVCGAVRAVRGRPHAPDRIEVLAKTDYVDKLGRALAARGLASLRRYGKRVVEAVLCNHQEHLTVALEEFGFQRSHVLAQMRFNLRSSTFPDRIRPA